MKTKKEMEKKLEEVLKEEKVSEENKPVYLAGMRKGLDLAEEIYKK